MKHDLAQLTDMIDIKMTGILNMVEKWMPVHNTIKKTLLQDIQHVKQEINSFKVRETSKKQHPTQSNITCRNGNNCWYLQQGRCWFKYEKKTISKRNTIANRNHSGVAHSLPNESATIKTANECKKSQLQLTNHCTQHTKIDNVPNNINKKQKKKKKKRQKRKKKKKKQNIDLIFESFKYDKAKNDKQGKKQNENENENMSNSINNMEESQLICHSGCKMLKLAVKV